MRRALVLALLLVHAPPATAATVEVRTTEVQVGKGRFITDHVVRVEAAAGEVNRIEMSGLEVLVVRDPGGGLVAGRACTGGGREVSCPDPVTRVEALLGDRGDALVVRAPAPFTWVDAGQGDDAVTGAGMTLGGPGADVLTGTAERDVLNGGTGSDRLLALEGDDELVGGDADRAPDVLDGGAGLDLAKYAGRTDPVHVDLAAGTGGAPGEGDAVAGIDRVWGGEGPDVLRGGEAADDLDGLAGADVIDGRGGDDFVDGWGGDDVVQGGPGDDTVAGSDGRDRLLGGDGNDRAFDEDGSSMSGGAGDDVLDTSYAGGTPEGRVVVRCGRGRDRVGSSKPRVRIAADCEAAGDAGIVMLEGPRVRRGGLTWRVRPLVRRRTRFEVRVRLADGRLAGRGRVRVRRARAAVVRVAFDRAGRRALRRAGPLRVRIAVLERGARTAAWTAAV